MKIRCVREAGGLGDVIRCFPVFDGLKKKYPDSVIHFYCLHSYRELVTTHCSSVDAFIGLHQHGRRGRFQPIDDTKYSYLRRNVKYDLTVDLFCPAYKHEVDTDGGCYLERTFLWCEAAGVETTTPVYGITEEELEWSSIWKDETGHDPDKMIAIQPFSTAITRGYHNPHWHEVINALIEEGFFVTLLDCCTGRFRDFPASRKEVSRPWSQLGAILYAQSVILAPDSGIFHFAGALSKPVLGLFGSTSGELISSIYPTAEYLQVENENVIDLPRQCSPPCYGRGRRGYNDKCRRDGCRVLISLKPETVVEKVLLMHKAFLERKYSKSKPNDVVSQLVCTQSQEEKEE